MSFDGLDAAIDSVRLPPPPVRPQRETRSAWSAPWRAIKGAAAEGVGSAADLINAFGATYASTLEGDPMAELAVGKQAVAEGARRGRELAAAEDVFQSDVGRSFRNVAKETQPDPATATTAENVIYQLVRPVAKLAAGGILGGGLGVVAASAEEGFTVSDELAQRGVDVRTRGTVGATSAATLAGSALLPMFGPTLKATAALYAAGGASNIAQTALTREILARADYGKIAAEYDPLDPTLWALSFGIPAPFAAFGAARNLRAMREARAGAPGGPPAGDRPVGAGTPPMPHEAVDAALVHNLTLLRSEHDRGGQIPPEPNLAPDQRVVENRFRAQVLADPDAALRAYAALPDTAGGKIVNTDEARELSPDYAASLDSRSLLAQVVQGPASWIARRQWERLLAAPPQTGEVLILGGGAGSGKTSSLEQVAPSYRSDYDAIYDTTLANPTKSMQVIEEALASGRRVKIAFTARDPSQSLEAVMWRAQKKGRTVPYAIAAQAHIDAPQTLAMLVSRYKANDRVRFELVDNTRGERLQRVVELGDFPDFDYNQLAERAVAAARQAHAEGKIRETVLRGLVGRSEGEAPPRLPPREDGSQELGVPGSVPPRPLGPTRPAGPAGTAAEVVTERGLTAPVRYRLAEADDLTTSHTDDLTPNTAFPAELQPRDRTRAASAEQIARIENGIRPELLGESVKASDGAPIIGPDGIVESGNARTIALRRAYASDNASGYRAWLEQTAARFGLTPEQVQGMRRPVLVRERLGDVDRAEFARQANESAIADLAPAEQARADAARIDDLSGLVANDDGTISVTRSGDFLRRFMQRAVSPNERGAMMQADGRLSQAGQQRLRNAVFAKAYGDPELLAMLTESTDSNVRNVLAGLLRAAPDVARLQDLIAAGARQPIDVADDIVAAVRELARLRDEGVSVEQFLAQGDMLGGALAPELNNLLVGLRENARSPRRVAEMVRQLVDAVDALGDPRQASILDGAPPGKADLTADVVERMRGVRDEPTDAAPAEGQAADPLDRSIADRVGALEAQQPDMVIRIDEQGQPVTLADELDRIRREAREGTDTELGAVDADLLRVAADCALSGA